MWRRLGENGIGALPFYKISLCCPDSPQAVPKDRLTPASSETQDF